MKIRIVLEFNQDSDWFWIKKISWLILNWIKIQIEFELKMIRISFGVWKIIFSLKNPDQLWYLLKIQIDSRVQERFLCFNNPDQFLSFIKIRIHFGVRRNHIQSTNLMVSRIRIRNINYFLLMQDGRSLKAICVWLQNILQNMFEYYSEM